MKVLLIDNSKADLCEFTRLLEKWLQSNVEEVVCCDDIDDIVTNLNEKEYDAAILSGSSINLSEPNRLEYVRKSISTILRLHTPILGICFGMQLIASSYGGFVKRLDYQVKEESKIQVLNSVLMNTGDISIKVTCSHQDYVSKLPPDFKICSMHKNCIYMFESIKFLRFGVQFHPECKVDGESVCVLHNFFKFVLERSSLPIYIPDELWVDVICNLPKKRVRHFLNILSIDEILHIWHNHRKIWNMPSIMIS